mmetsp:Transcript_48143/g.134419  ORF Transcript_48143/g.134419 Transcript_48143/m.134419 type:complete len:242 (+) Transcript_48143:574-1299(+)
MWRERCLWPLHLVQAPQEPQSSQEQSTAPLGSRHFPASHSAISFKGPVHALPVPWVSVTMRRVRECCPLPQEPAQSVQAPQSPSTQSTFTTSSRQPSAPTLQGATSFSGPSQNLPSPLPGVTMPRFRSFQPSQLQLQPLHGVHSANVQSTGVVVHVSPSLHGLYSWARPSGGLPQSFAGVFTLRVRQVTPPTQDAVHSSHSDQEPQTPSTQMAQDCVLHATTSVLFSAGQSLPRPSGAMAM